MTRDCKSEAWVETWTGRVVYPMNPDPSVIILEDIKHHLAIIPRYNGATARPYYVAEHSVIMADLARRQGLQPVVCLNFLLHDAAEAYLQDILTPIKCSFPLIHDVEDRLLRTIHEALEVPYLDGPVRSQIKGMDEAIVLDERAALMPNHRPENRWIVDKLDIRPLGVQIRGLEWQDAETEFELCFQELWVESLGGNCTHPWHEREVYGDHARCRACGKDLGRIARA